MTKTIIYIQATDEPGLISNISKIITDNQGNIETTKMIKLTTVFNLIMLISIEDKNLIKIEKKLLEIKNKKNNFFIRINTSKNISLTSSNLYKFTLKGADTEGLVYKFTDLLLSYEINIENMDTEIKNAPITGHPLFFLNSILDIPCYVNLDEIKNKLNNLANKSNVAIKLKANI